MTVYGMLNRAFSRYIDIIIQPMAYIISGLLIIRYVPVRDVFYARPGRCGVSIKPYCVLCDVLLGCSREQKLKQ